MVVQCRKILAYTVVITEVEAHVKEQLLRSFVHLHLRCRETIDKPVYCVVFSNAIVDEFGVLSRDIWDNTQRFACIVFAEHMNLHLAMSGCKCAVRVRTSYGELKIRSPKRMEPRDSGCLTGPSLGSQNRSLG